jgi:GGDEF domain-containing protein
MGIALYPQHGDNYESLWQNADKALYISKRSGKSSIAIADGRSLREDL